MNHSDAVAKKVDALVEVVLGELSEHFLCLCIVQKDFSVSYDNDVIVIVSYELDGLGLDILSRVVAGIGHATILVIVKFRICED